MLIILERNGIRSSSNYRRLQKIKCQLTVYKRIVRRLGHLRNSSAAIENQDFYCHSLDLLTQKTPQIMITIITKIKKKKKFRSELWA